MNNIINNIITYLTDRRLFWSIMLFYVFVKLLPVVAFDKKFTYAVVLIAFFVLILRLIKLIIYDKKLNINKYRLTTIIFIIICSFSLIFNVGFDLSKFNIRNSEYRIFYILIINFFVIFSFCSNSDLNNDIKYLDNISLIISVFSFINILLSTIDTIINNRDRIWGLTTSVWSFTHFVALSLGINIYLLLKDNKLPYKKFFYINLIFHFVVLIFIQQRAGYLCVFIGLILSLILIVITGRIHTFKEYMCENKVKLLILTIFIIIIVVILSQFINLNRIFTKLVNFNSNGRLQIKKTSLQVLLNNDGLLFGLIGNLHNITSKYDYSALKVYISNAAFHDISFCILMCFGIFAFIIFVILIIQILRRLILLIKYAKVNNDIFNILVLCSFGIIGSLVGSFFDDNMIVNLPYLPNLMFFILCSIICSIDIKKDLNVK